MTTTDDQKFHSGHLSIQDRMFANTTPRHISFPAHGRSVITCLILADVGVLSSSKAEEQKIESQKRIISASDDHSIHIYSPSTGELEMELQGHEGGVWALSTSGGLLVSGSTDQTVRVWDLGDDGKQAPQSGSDGESGSGNGASGRKGECLHVFCGHTSTVRSLTIVEPEMVDVGGEFGGPG